MEEDPYAQSLEIVLLLHQFVYSLLLGQPMDYHHYLPHQSEMVEFGMMSRPLCLRRPAAFQLRYR